MPTFGLATVARIIARVFVRKDYINPVEHLKLTEEKDL